MICSKRNFIFAELKAFINKFLENMKTGWINILVISLLSRNKHLALPVKSRYHIFLVLSKYLAQYSSCKVNKEDFQVVPFASILFLLCWFFEVPNFNYLNTTSTNFFWITVWPSPLPTCWLNAKDSFIHEIIINCNK